MKFLVASQRVDRLADRVETRDGLDQAWTSLCNSIGIGLVPVPNRLDTLDPLLDCLKPSALLLTGGNAVAGGPDTGLVAPERDETEERLLMWAIAEGVPVLAVCRGFQFVNVHFGGRLRTLKGHVGTTHALAWSAIEPRISHTPALANSFHSVGMDIDDLAPCLKPLAQAHDGSVEAAIHRTKPILGIMWHPERAPVAEGAFLEVLRAHLLAAT